MQYLHQADALLDFAHQAAKRYIATIAERAVFPDGDALAGLGGFDEQLSAGPRDPMDTLRLLDECGSPATVATTGGRYFGFVTGGSFPVATAADWLISAWDQTGTMPISSPAVASIEAIAGQWVRELLGLPDKAVTAFVTGASVGNLTALAAARRHLLLRRGWDVEERGLSGSPPLRIVAGAELHSTLPKLISLLGFGREAIELVPTDDQGRLLVDHLPPLDDQTILLLQAGNVNSGSFDRFDEIIPLAKEAGAWVHVDGAFGLWAAASPKFRHLTQGVELADSWVTDGHKWLNVPYDCGMIICAHPSAIRGAMQVGAAYMPAGEEIPAKDLVPEFSRRARGVTVWAVLRTLGRTGVADLVERCCLHAQYLADGLRELGFEVHNQVVLNQIVASMKDAPTTAAIQRHIQESGEAWFGPTRWQDNNAVRLSVSSWATSADDVKRTLHAVSAALAAVGR